jgi:hypothetical protein
MKLIIIAMLAAVALACRAEPLSFGLFGDLPYNDRERTQLPKLIEEMDREHLSFVVHDGDIKNGHSECSDAVFKDMLGVFQASAHPLIYVLGDNEWTDCHRKNNGSYDPLERLEKLRSVFFPDELSLGRQKLQLERQSADPAFAMYRENVRWIAAGVIFVGLNLPGSDNNYNGTGKEPVPAREFVERSRANQAWLAQAFDLARKRSLRGLMLVIQANPDFDALQSGKPTPGYRDFLWQLREETQAFAGEVVLVHGDTHSHRIDQPLLDPKTGEPLKNFRRVETYGSPFPGWVKATADTADPRVFRFEARPYVTR